MYPPAAAITTAATIPWTIHAFALVEESDDAVEDDDDGEGQIPMIQTNRRIWKFSD